MKTTKLAAAVLVCGLSTTGAFAGNLSAAGTDDDTIVMLPEVTTSGSAGSIGSLGGAGGSLLPAAAALLILGALAAGGGT